MDEKEFERKEKARLDEMYDAMVDDSDCDYDIVKNKYMDDFFSAFTKFIETMQKEKA